MSASSEGSVRYAVHPLKAVVGGRPALFMTAELVSQVSAVCMLVSAATGLAYFGYIDVVLSVVVVGGALSFGLSYLARRMRRAAYASVLEVGGTIPADNSLPPRWLVTTRACALAVMLLGFLACLWNIIPRYNEQAAAVAWAVLMIVMVHDTTMWGVRVVRRRHDPGRWILLPALAARCLIAVVLVATPPLVHPTSPTEASIFVAILAAFAVVTVGLRVAVNSQRHPHCETT